ncbi:MAG: SH3 domain-containing protein [Chloroflexota bacterium]|jgi:hypothetical protein
MRARILVTILLFAVLGSGCNVLVQPTPTPTAAFTSTPLPPTATPSPSPTPLPTTTPTPTVTPFAPFDARTSVDYVNIRSNPGYLFAIESSVRRGTTLRVQGKSPGGEWISVEAPNGARGWVFAQLLESAVDLQAVPVLAIEDAITVMGRVVDRTGQPISGIQFMITQGEPPNQLRTDAVTDAEGVFYAYMPRSVRGDWVVEFTAVACTSNTMDENCNCLGGVCGAPDPPKVTINLPDFPALVFEWR